MELSYKNDLYENLEKLIKIEERNSIIAIIREHQKFFDTNNEKDIYIKGILESIINDIEKRK